MSRYWTCQRTTAGIRCRAVNANTKRKCARCGKPRPAKRKPAHMKALNLSYADYVKLNGGEFCGICGHVPPLGKRLHRDHEHVGDGRARGCLCFRCNSALRPYMTLEWLHAAAAYLERVEART